MKKYILFITILFLSQLKVFSCGWGEPDYYDFYSLFMEGDRDENCNCGTSGNLDEWKIFFGGKFNEDLVNDVVFNYTVDQMDVLIAIENDQLYLEAFKYLQYAKKLGLSSQRIGTIDLYSWDYDEIIKQEVFDVDLLSQGMSSFESSNDKELKMRYAYQIIRYLHYNGKWQEAIDFFENNVPKLKLKNELYYYCLDQVSGCYYSLNDYVTAAYGFIKVVENSKDRKQSASLSFGSLSFSLESNNGFSNLIKKCKTSSEKILARVLTTSDNYSYADAKWIIENEFNEEALLSIYYYNGVYEVGGYSWLSSSDDKEFTENSGDKNELIIQKIIDHPKTKNHDFWYSCLAYLAFEKGNFTEASRLYNSIENLGLIDVERYSFFLRMYTVLSGDVLIDDSENELYSIYQTEVVGNVNSDLMRDVYLYMLRSYYFKYGHDLKANLLVYLKEDVDQIYDFEELDELQQLELKFLKNDLEIFLLEKAFNGVSDIDSYINEKKASLFLLENNFGEAKKYFDLLPQDYNVDLIRGYSDEVTNYQFNGYSNVPKEIFSVNIKEGFNFFMKQIMTDKVCFQSQFDFIDKTFSKAKLNECLIKLNEMAAENNSEANFLLGNYYYNTSGFGYFRNILNYYPENNLCSYCRYNELAIDNLSTSDFFYSQAIQETDDMEFKAKITYLLAKNTLFDDNDEGFYSSIEPIRSDECKTLFHELETTYFNTNFYDEIIGECSVFSYYVVR